MVVETTSHCRYFLTIVDDCSRYTWIFLMINKLEARLHFQNFIKDVRVQFSSNVQIIRTNNGLEFNMPKFYSSHGIIYQCSCVHTQQNGVVERKHQHILNVAHALRF